MKINRTERAIWFVNAHGKTMRQAVDEFARCYWSIPRAVKATIGAGGHFQMADGFADYRIELDSKSQPPRYIVSRIEPDTSY